MKESLPIHAEVARPARIEQAANPRLARMRFLSRLLDTSILLPGGYRIGIDPIIGLVPAIGDFIAATLSVWLIYDAARLGVPKRTLARMGLNVLVESVTSAVPVVGDVIDAIWKANARNMVLVEAAYTPGLPPRSRRKLMLTFLIILVAIYSVLLASVYFALKLLIALFT